jgi:glycosyltransferase involved in cell wall biosynthesis
MQSLIKKPTVTVLIPALNEEKTIERMIVDCLKMDKYDVTALVVIDSKTVDRTDIVAKKAGAKVVYGKGLGKGSTVRSSIPYIKGEYIVQIDADYQFIPKDLPKMIEPLLKGYDVTLGTRYQKGAHVENGSVSALKLFGSYFLSLVTSIAAGQRITDVMAGYKGFKTKVLIDLNPKTNHFGYEAELVVRAAKKRYKIVNVPITYKKRIVGNSSVSSIKHGFLVLQTIIKTALE